MRPLEPRGIRHAAVGDTAGHHGTIAATFGFGNLNAGPSPDDDRVTGELPALHVYQLALPAPTPRAGVDFEAAAAKRSDELFSGKAGCNACHVDPLWTER